LCLPKERQTSFTVLKMVTCATYTVVGRVKTDSRESI
jgi:hypothetical protein